MYADQFEIYHGNANPELARKIAHWLDSEPGQAEVFQFANENIFVRILDNVREKDVFLVQPTSRPVNQSIMELLIMIDAFKRASAGRITAVVPYYAYGRSDKKDQPRVPITARLVADMITVAGADRVLTMDLHQGQIQGFFNIPVDELTAVHMLCRYFIDKHLSDVRRRHRPRVRQARPHVRRDPRRAAGHHREAPPRQPRPGRGHERHRRRPRPAGDHRRRRGRHRRHAHRDRPRARARGRQRDLRLRHPRRAVRPGDRADPPLQPARARRHRHRAPAGRPSSCRSSRCCRSRR